MKLEIESVDNGWIVSCLVEESTGLNREVKSVIQSIDSDVQAFRQVLWEVNSLIGPTTSRYDKERIVIFIEQGDKYLDGIEEEHA